MCPTAAAGKLAQVHFVESSAPLPIAHRGDGEHATENTMEAFESAVRLGFSVLETDAHATKDGVLVAFHDPDLSRVAGRQQRISELSWAELSEVELIGGGRVPRLDALFSAWPNVNFNLDPKSDRVAELLPDFLKRLDFPRDRLCVGSFSDARLTRLRDTLGLFTSVGPIALAGFRLRASLGLSLGRPESTCIQAPVRYYGLPVIGPRFVRAVHEAGMRLHAWTINEESEMNRLLDLGLDGIMTDRPALLKRVFQARGIWPG